MNEIIEQAIIENSKGNYGKAIELIIKALQNQREVNAVHLDWIHELQRKQKC